MRGQRSGEPTGRFSKNRAEWWQDDLYGHLMTTRRLGPSGGQFGEAFDYRVGWWFERLRLLRRGHTG